MALGRQNSQTLTRYDGVPQQNCIENLLLDTHSPKAKGSRVSYEERDALKPRTIQAEGLGSEYCILQ